MLAKIFNAKHVARDPDGAAVVPLWLVHRLTLGLVTPVDGGGAEDFDGLRWL